MSNLALRARAGASEEFEGLVAALAIDGSVETRWSGIPGHNEGVWFELSWDKPVDVGCVVIHQFDRFVMELDLQVHEAATGEWRTLAHLGRPGRRLHSVVLWRGQGVATTRLRIANITNGPSFTEVEVFAETDAEPPALVLGSDIDGRFLGVVTDRFGAAPIVGAEVLLQGDASGGPWTARASSNDHGLFTAAMPIGLRGLVRASVTMPGSARAEEPQHSFESCDFQYGLTPPGRPSTVTLLDGKWRFRADDLVDPSNLSEGSRRRFQGGFERESKDSVNTPESASADLDDSSWREIDVPSHFAMQGASPASGGAMCRRRFGFPQLDAVAGERVKLRFDAVYSGAEVFVNGRLFSRHEGGATPFEVDVTDDVLTGENLLAVHVLEHTTCSDHLDQMSEYAYFPLAGIMRSVTLFTVPELHLCALAVSARFDEGFRDATLEVRLGIANESSRGVEHGELRVSLEDPEGDPVPLTLAPTLFRAGPWSRTDLDLSIPVAAPQCWDAEHPHLYRLRLEILADGRPVQEVVQSTGFRQTDVRGAALLINGAPVKIRGTCHHDQHPLLGRAVTAALERQDVELIKEANLNALRTSHYPPHPALLQACDEVGLYVEDEAPFCWVGISNDLRVVPRILQLTLETVIRDRNHPCVFMWSLCNESEFGRGFERSHEWVRALDPGRPTGAATSQWLEIATLHNPLAIARIDEHEGLDRPLLFDESLCIFQGIFGDVAEMWVDPGVRDLYVTPLPAILERFYKSRATQGSLIWCFADDIFCLPGRGLEYGRGATRSHFLETSYQVPGRGLAGDAPWGFVDGWRRGKPEFWAVKKLHSPVVIDEQCLAKGAADDAEESNPSRAKEPGTLKIPVKNRYDFADLAELDVRWQVDGESGRTRVAAPPGGEGVLVIAPARAPRPGAQLELCFVDHWQREVDRFVLPVGLTRDPGPPIAAPALRPLRIEDESTLGGEAVRIIGADFELAFDRRTGALRRGVAHGEPLRLEAPRIHVLPTSAPLAPLPDATTFRLAEMEVGRAGEEVVVSVHGSYRDFAGVVRMHVARDGSIAVDTDFEYTGGDLRAREIGVRLSLSAEFTRLDWRRRGEWGAYPEDHIGRNRGTAAAFPAASAGGEVLTDFGGPPWPWALDPSAMGCNDFRSTKRNLEWSALQNERSIALFVRSNGSQHLRASVEPDRVALHLNDWYGGTNAGWWEWVHNYGEGRMLKSGEHLTSHTDLKLGRVAGR